MTETQIKAGKTIASVEQIGAEYGRTYDYYTCLTFTDGTKQLIGGPLNPFKPRPSVEEMKKAPLFFSAEEIADEVLRLEIIAREQRKSYLESRRREYEQLKKVFEQ
jgi:hypothetical protein